MAIDRETNRPDLSKHTGRAKTGTPDAQDPRVAAWIVENMPFGKYFALKQPVPESEQEDLISLGYLAVAEAARNKFDPSRPCREKNTTLITRRFIDLVRKNGILKRHTYQRLQQFYRAEEDLWQELNHIPGKQETASILGPDVGKAELLENFRWPLSLQAPITEDDLTLAEVIADETAENPAEVILTGLIKDEDLDRLPKALGCLDERKAHIVMATYGHNLTDKQLAQELNVSPTRIRQLRKDGLTQLRQCLVREICCK